MLICIMCQIMANVVSHYDIVNTYYTIKALNRGNLFMCSYGSFSGCHGNESQELIEKTGWKWYFS